MRRALSASASVSDLLLLLSNHNHLADYFVASGGLHGNNNYKKEVTCVLASPWRQGVLGAGCCCLSWQLVPPLDAAGYSITLTFYNCIVPTGFLPWEILGCFPWRKTAATESRYPTYSACWVFQCFHNPPNSDVDYRIFNACNCTQGCMDTRKRVCTESWLREKNPLPHRGIEPVLAAWRSDALTNWATSPQSTFNKWTSTLISACIYYPNKQQ